MPVVKDRNIYPLSETQSQSSYGLMFTAVVRTGRRGSIESFRAIKPTGWRSLHKKVDRRDDLSLYLLKGERAGLNQGSSCCCSSYFGSSSTGAVRQ